MMNYMTSKTRIPPYMAFPRFLLALNLSETARLVYTVLLDRARLSQVNAKYVDKDGRVYLIYPIESLAEAIHRSAMTVKYALRDLEKLGLIERRRQGIGQPNCIYVKFPSDSHPSLSLQGNISAPLQDTFDQDTVSLSDNKLSLSQTDFFPSHGQDPVSLTDRNLSGNKNHRIKETKSNKDIESRRALTAFGTFHNVFLSEENLEKLRTQIPDYRKYIDRLSVYMHSRKRTYPDHAATILRWAQQDNAIQPVRTYTYEEGESL